MTGYEGLLLIIFIAAALTLIIGLALILTGIFLKKKHKKLKIALIIIGSIILLVTIGLIIYNAFAFISI